MLSLRAHPWFGLVSMAASLAAFVACGSGSAPAPAPDGTGNSPPPKSLYADDAGAVTTVPSATPTPTPPPTVPVDAGAPDASDGGFDPSTVCKDLAFCCAQPKVCDEEMVACNQVVQTNDPSQCTLTLASYQQIGCAHDDTAPVPYLPTFQGCSGGAGGGFWSWFGF